MFWPFAKGKLRHSTLRPHLPATIASLGESPASLVLLSDLPKRPGFYSIFEWFLDVRSGFSGVYSIFERFLDVGRVLAVSVQRRDKNHKSCSKLLAGFQKPFKYVERSRGESFAPRSHGYVDTFLNAPAVTILNAPAVNLQSQF